MILLSTKKVFNWALIVAPIFLLFTMTWALVSNTFDADSGWQLRFGQEVLSGHFPLVDTYTWGNYGAHWVNTSWGGDIVYWLIVHNFGYPTLHFFFSLCFAVGLLLMSTIKRRQLTFVGSIAALAIFFAVKHLVVVRLALLAPLFFVLLLYILEYCSTKVQLWLLPLLIWVWQFWHGSWMLAFIVVGIYFIGDLAQQVLFKQQCHSIQPQWNRADRIRQITATVIAAIAVQCNPYGLVLSKEMVRFFTESYYKQIVLEWAPSFLFPVYWSSLVLAVIVVFFALLLFYKQKISFKHLLLIVALFISGLLYKRNIIFVLMVGIPLMQEVLYYMASILGQWKHLVHEKFVIVAQTFFVIFLVSTGIYFLFQVNIRQDVWSNKKVLMRAGIPYSAVQFLAKDSGGRVARIFNEFNWTGYIEWVVPRAVPFMDGRLVVSGKSKDDSTVPLLKAYYVLLNSNGGLTVLEKNEVQYVLLGASYGGRHNGDDWLNELFFSQEVRLYQEHPVSQLEKELMINSRWQLVYQDSEAKVWKKN